MINDTFGLVPFLDGGTVSDNAFNPFDDQSLLFGTGLGVRVNTPVGPIRLDVAVPLQRRQDVDQWYQFYISLGQAF